eukprot:PhF_6_TR38749/c0_g1_i1/m.58015
MGTITNLGYFCAKGFALYLLYALMDTLGCGLTFRLVSFLFLTPLVKYYHMKKQSSTFNLKRYAFSLVNDTLTALLYFKVYLPKFIGPSYFLFPLVNGTWMILVEYTQYLLFAGPTEKYVVKMGSHWYDYTLIPIASATFFFYGSMTDMGQQLADSDGNQAATFLWFLPSMLVIDIVFGVTHYVTHKIPSLWKLHAVHHQYKREDLNSFGNFYAEVSDSFLMNAPFLISLIITGLCKQSYFANMELIYVAALTHNKYTDNQMNLMVFWEWDLIDMVLGEIRVAGFHNAHHQFLDKNFGAFGIADDDTVIALSAPFIPRKN